MKFMHLRTNTGRDKKEQPSIDEGQTIGPQYSTQYIQVRFSFIFI